MDSKQVESAVYKARTQIIWGKPKEEAVTILKDAGMSQDRIEAAIRDWLKERARTIRERGVRYLVIGLGIIAFCIFIAFLVFPRSVCNVSIVGLCFKAGVLGLCVPGGVYGIHLTFRGIELLVKGSKKSGSVTDL